MSIEKNHTINNLGNELFHLSQVQHIDSDINETITTLVIDNLELINSSKNSGIKNTLVALSDRFENIDANTSAFFKRIAENITVSKKRSRVEFLQNDSSESSSVAKKPKIDTAIQTPPELFNTPKKIDALATNINVLDKNNAKRVHIAAEKGQIEVIKLLYAHGADIHARAHDGATPLHAAAFNGQVEVIKLLHALGADIHALNENGATPVLLAAYEGHLEAIETLHARGADINTPDKYGYTPVYTIVLNRERFSEGLRTKLIVKLCDLGANINIKVPSRRGHFSALDMMIQDQNMHPILDRISYNLNCNF